MSLPVLSRLSTPGHAGSGGGAMSMVFDAVIVAASAARVERAFKGLDSSLSLALGQITDGVFAVYRKGGYRVFDVEEDKRVATYLSRVWDKALLIFWDDRVDCDQAFLFENGQMVNQFGIADERYVLIDETGEPQTRGYQYTHEEL